MASAVPETTPSCPTPETARAGRQYPVGRPRSSLVEYPRAGAWVDSRPVASSRARVWFTTCTVAHGLLQGMNIGSGNRTRPSL